MLFLGALFPRPPNTEGRVFENSYWIVLAGKLPVLRNALSSAQSCKVVSWRGLSIIKEQGLISMNSARNGCINCNVCWHCQTLPLQKGLVCCSANLSVLCICIEERKHCTPCFSARLIRVNQDFFGSISSHTLSALLTNSRETLLKWIFVHYNASAIGDICNSFALAGAFVEPKKDHSVFSEALLFNMTKTI